MLTLALATIVVLTVAALALMLWPEAPPPAPPDDLPPNVEDGMATGAGDERERATLPDA